MRQLTAISLNNQNITAAQNVASYTANSPYMLFARLFANQVAGDGVYTAYAGIHTGGSSPVYEMQPRTTPTVATGVTAIGLSTIPIPVASGEVFKVYLQGLAADSSAPDIKVDIWDDGPISVSSVAALIGTPLNGGTITLRQGDTLDVDITGLGALTGYTSLWVTAKPKGHRNIADALSLFQIKNNASGSGDGLLYANGATATAGDGSITIDSEANGDINPVIDEAVTANFRAGDYDLDVQVLISGKVTTLTEYTLVVVEDVTKALT